MSTMKISNGSESIEGILARDVRVSLRKEMRRLYYTPRALAKGVGIPYRTIKFWLKGQGVITQEQYLAICKHLAIDHLEGASFSQEDEGNSNEGKDVQKEQSGDVSCEDNADPSVAFAAEDELFAAFARHDWKTVVELAKDKDVKDPFVQYCIGYCYEFGIDVATDEGKAFEWYEKSASNGNPQAQYRLGVCYGCGKGTEKDLVEAFRWYKKSAENGDGDGQLSLGGCYEFGHGVEKNERKAFEWYKKSAENGNAMGQCYLGAMYEYGTGTEVDLDEAFRWYEMAANNNDGLGQRYLGNMYENGKGTEKNIDEARKWYKKAAENGNEEAKKALERLNEPIDLLAYFDEIRGITNDGHDEHQKNDEDEERKRDAEELAIAVFKDERWEEGVSLAEKIEANDARLQCYLGHCYENGLGTTKDVKLAVEWYRKAAEQGNEKAQIALARMYEDGRGVAENKHEAIKWYKKAAEQGDCFAQYSLGFFYEFGDGVPKDESEAVKWYRKAAEQGDSAAQLCLGEMYENGECVVSDYKEAAKWYRLAADQAEPDGCWHLGQMYEYGLGVDEDLKEAEKWYRKAVELGCDYAMTELESMEQAKAQMLLEEAKKAFEEGRWGDGIAAAMKTDLSDASLLEWLGYCHRYGKGVAVDYDKAFKWYLKSAENGNRDGQYHVAEMFEDGQGVKEDEAKAFYWYKKSAGNGCVQAQCELGSCYENGKGTEKNLAEAFKWYLKAAENGDAHGQCCVAKMFEDGQGVTKDEAKAFYWYKKAAENGNGWGQHEVGCCYECGKGTEKNLSEALKWYLRSAEDELELAISEVIHSYELGRKVGHMYEFGLGTEKNLSKAYYWYKKAADIGDEDAKKCLERMEKKREEELVSNAIVAFKANKWNEAFELARKTDLKDAVLQSWMGHCYECGNGVEKNLKEAFKWYEKSALNGSGWSQCRLGYSYEYGNGTERNYEKALEWYAKAAEQGNNCAQCNLGLMFEYGRGVPIGLATAFQWYKKSAESGWAVGKYRLGLCYETGKGVAIDVEAARGWYKKAAYDGNEDAKKALLRLDEEQNKVANLNHVVASNPQSTCGHGRKLRKPTKRNAINEMYRYITKIMIDEYEIKDIEFDDVDDYLYAVEVPNDTDEDILMDASNLFFHEIGILEDERDLELEEETEYCTVHRNEHSGKYFVIFNHPFVIDAKAAGEMVGDTVREFVEATRKRLAESEARESDADEYDGDEAWMRELADGIKSGEVRSKSGEGYFVLAGEPFDEIKSGEKTTEYRDITPRNLSMSIGIRTVKIQRGYGHPGQPPAQMRFEVQSVGFLDANKCECDPYDIPEGFIATTIAIHLGKRIE